MTKNPANLSPEAQRFAEEFLAERSRQRAAMIESASFPAPMPFASPSAAPVRQRALSSLVDVIFARRSVRSYKPQKLDRATLNALLASAVRAPTAMHEEPWAFVIVQDPTRLKRLSDRAKELLAEEAPHHADRGGHSLDFFADPGFNLFYNAGTLIVVCGPTTGPFVAADCWLAAENLMLTATSMGLGTCVIGSALRALNSPEWKAELGIPANFSAFAPIIAGVPSEEGVPPPRKEPRILAWK